MKIINVQLNAPLSWPCYVTLRNLELVYSNEGAIVVMLMKVILVSAAMAEYVLVFDAYPPWTDLVNIIIISELLQGMRSRKLEYVVHELYYCRCIISGKYTNAYTALLLNQYILIFLNQYMLLFGC